MVPGILDRQHLGFRSDRAVAKHSVADVLDDCSRKSEYEIISRPPASRGGSHSKPRRPPVEPFGAGTCANRGIYPGFEPVDVKISIELESGPTPFLPKAL